MEMQNTGPDSRTSHTNDTQERIWTWYDIPPNRRISFGPGKIMLLFTLSGKIALTHSKGNTYTIDKQCFFLKPMDTGFDIDVLGREEARLAVCSICIYSLRFLKNFLKRIIGWKKTHTGEEHGSFHWMETERHTSAFLDNLIGLLSENQFRSDYCQLKLEELFIYLETYCDRDGLRAVFSPLPGSDIDFFNDVISNYRSCKSVDGLAARLRMSRITFNRRFMASFGTSASKWLRGMRNNELLKMIVSSDLSFTEIAFNMGFSSSAYLTEYCRKNWGKTPTQLRIEGK